MYFKAEYTL